MFCDESERLATAAVLAHNVLGSLSVLRYAFDQLELSSDRAAWAAELAEVIDSIPGRLDVAVHQLRIVAAGVPSVFGGAGTAAATGVDVGVNGQRQRRPVRPAPAAG